MTADVPSGVAAVDTWAFRLTCLMGCGFPNSFHIPWPSVPMVARKAPDPGRHRTWGGARVVMPSQLVVLGAQFGSRSRVGPLGPRCPGRGGRGAGRNPGTNLQGLIGTPPGAILGP